MALRPSQMIPLGTKAPHFELLDVTKNKNVSLEDFKGKKGTLVVFMCNHCPYVVYLMKAFVAWSKTYQEKGIQTIAISSNDIDNYPQDGPKEMKALAEKEKFNFPYLFDATQEIALAYEASCTPDFYLFDANMKLYYRGRFDGARPGNDIPISGADLSAAANTLLAGEVYKASQYPSMGCNIKWTEANTPKYFFQEE